MINRSAALVEALTGRFTDRHVFMVKVHLDRIDQINATMTALDSRIDSVLEPFQFAWELLMTIPGISKNVATAVIAEAGVDMAVFPTAGNLLSWAGVCPRAERVRQTDQIRPYPGPKASLTKGSAPTTMITPTLNELNNESLVFQPILTPTTRRLRTAVFLGASSSRVTPLDSRTPSLSS